MGPQDAPAPLAIQLPTVPALGGGVYEYQIESIGVTVADVNVRVDAEGRFCLNDLHRAAGGESKHQPANWLRLDSVRELAREVDSSEVRNPAITAKQGHGTYVAKELVYAYAMWISPEFHLKVIQAYDALEKNEAPERLASEFAHPGVRLRFWARLPGRRNWRAAPQRREVPQGVQGLLVSAAVRPEHQIYLSGNKWYRLFSARGRQPSIRQTVSAVMHKAYTQVDVPLKRIFHNEAFTLMLLGFKQLLQRLRKSGTPTFRW